MPDTLCLHMTYTCIIVFVVLALNFFYLTSYSPLTFLLVQSHDSSDSSLVKVLHWGASKKPSIFPSPERLVELGAQQIVPSEGQCLVLTGQGTVVSLTSQGPGEFTETVSRVANLVGS